jgi:hypothetical protein
MDYPLEQLDPERFQHVCQSLLVREHRGTQCFPVGQPDGGRDAIRLSTGEMKNGFIVFQVKFTRDPAKIEDKVAWLGNTVEGERQKIEKLYRRGAKEYYLLTNLTGSAHDEVGTIDRLQAILDSLPMRSMCLWRNDINRRLDSAWDLKWVYPELMTGPDLIRTIVENGLSEYQQRRTNAIRSFVADQYDKDSEVKFKQVELQNKLLDLFVDVPLELPMDSETNRSALRFASRHLHLISQGMVEKDLMQRELFSDDYASYVRHRVNSQIDSATFLLSKFGQERVHRAVLEGAPGQGKSTITQYICQVHRMRILRAQEVDKLPEVHKSQPVRLPFRVDLRDLSAWLEKKDPFGLTDEGGTPAHWHRSLESFLAAQVRYHSGGAEFLVGDLQAIARISPLLIVFDGLDEVAKIQHRQAVVDEIKEGIKRLESNALSLQVLVTSRPAAFANSPGLSRDSFPHFQLAALPRSTIDLYAEKWLAARHLPQTDASIVRRILKDKLDAPHLRDLARNPMQLAILLSLIHTRGASLPDKRTALYDSYVELFFNRESEKSQIVRDNRDLLVNIHQYLAWFLHCRAETTATGGSIKEEELEHVLIDYLRREGHDSGKFQDIFKGMVERVVAIVSRVQGTFEFEVQPLREYFAARYLYMTAPYSPPGNEKRGTKVDRFDAVAKNFYWLNVARFYAGCYSIGELASLIDGVATLLESDEYKYLAHPRQLAAMLLADWVFTQAPRSVTDLCQLIFGGDGLRFMLASEERQNSGTDSLLLPEGGGRRELIHQLAQVMKTTASLGIGVRAAEVIQKNGGQEQFYQDWVDELRLRWAEQRLAWLSYGVHLGYISRASLSDLDQFFAGELTAPLLKLIVRAGRVDWIEADAGRVANGIQVLLDAPIFAGQEKVDRPLLAFAAVLNVERYTRAVKLPEEMPLIEAMRHDSWSMPELSADIEGGEDLRYCAEIVSLAMKQLELPVREWATKLQPWEALVEAIRARFGDRRVLIRIATMAAGIKSSDQCADASSPFDRTVSLCRRARYARLRAGQAAWWNSQLDAAPDDLARHFIVLILLIWGSPDTIVGALEAIDRIVSGMTDQEWNRLYNDVFDLSGESEANSTRAKRVSRGKIHKHVSDRARVLLSCRLSSADRVRLYRSSFGKYEGSDRAILKFCQAEAINSLLTIGRYDADDLRIIGLSYQVQPKIAWQGYYWQRAVSERANFSRDAALQILRNSGDYPSQLVGIAESRQRAVVGKAIRAVQSVANSESWFE